MNTCKSGVYRVVKGGLEPDYELVAVVTFRGRRSNWWFDEVAIESSRYDCSHNRLFGEQELTAMSLTKSEADNFTGTTLTGLDKYPHDVLLTVVDAQYYDEVEKFIRFIADVQFYEIRHYDTLGDAISRIYRKYSNGKKSRR